VRHLRATILRRHNLYKALQSVHTVGIQHCDLEPRNVLRDEEGTVRLVDFAIAESHSCLGEQCPELFHLRSDLGLAMTES